MNNIPVVKLGLMQCRDCFPIQLSEKDSSYLWTLTRVSFMNVQ